MEICDYSTYYQPVVMNDLFGFGRPMDPVGCHLRAGDPRAWPGAASSARSRPASASSSTSRSPRRSTSRPAEWDTDCVSGDVKAGTMGAVRFQVIGKVDGVAAGRPRARHPHPPRPGARVGAAARRAATAATAVRITGEPMMQVDFTHHGEHGDHNVSTA